MAGDADSQYNNSNRAFIQAFIARSTLTFDEAKPLLAAIFTAHGNSAGTPNAMVGPKIVLTAEREKRDPRRGCHPSRLQFLHLRSQQCHLPLRPRDPQHLSSNHTISHLRSRKLNQRSYHSTGDHTYTRRNQLPQTSPRRNVRDLQYATT